MEAINNSNFCHLIIGVDCKLFQHNYTFALFLYIMKILR